MKNNKNNAPSIRNDNANKPKKPGRGRAKVAGITAAGLLLTAATHGVMDQNFYSKNKRPKGEAAEKEFQESVMHYKDSVNVLNGGVAVVKMDSGKKITIKNPVIAHNGATIEKKPQTRKQKADLREDMNSFSGSAAGLSVGSYSLDPSVNAYVEGENGVDSISHTIVEEPGVEYDPDSRTYNDVVNRANESISIHAKGKDPGYTHVTLEEMLRMHATPVQIELDAFSNSGTEYFAAIPEDRDKMVRPNAHIAERIPNK